MEYRVTITEVNTAVKIVEARDEEDAENQVREMMFAEDMHNFYDEMQTDVIAEKLAEEIENGN
jgi:hypothetical protein